MEAPRQRIMLVDDSITNLTIGRNALIHLYDVYTIPSGEKLFMMLERVVPDLILLDVEMPGMTGYDVIRRLKKDEATARIPVIFLTAKNDDGSEIEGLSLGAIDYITKPFSAPLLQKRIETNLLTERQRIALEAYNNNLQQMVEEKTQAVTALQNAVLRTMAELVECRDDVTGSHIERTQRYLKILVDKMLEKNVYMQEIGQWDINLLLQSAQLHDVGKIQIKDSILMKPGRLTAEEFEIMKSHTVFGEQIIDRISRSAAEEDFLTHARIFAAAHHERWDGTGYPRGLAGLDIPLQGRMMAIADVYDALISERPYKTAYSHENSVDIIAEGAGTHFDPVLAGLFAEAEDEFRHVAETFKDGSWSQHVLT